MTRAVCFAAMLILCAFGSAVRARSGSPEAALRGRWEVEHVLPNLSDQTHWEMRPDNPALMYRELSIGDEVRFGDRDACSQQPWTPYVTTWSALFRKGFERIGGPERTRHPAPDDFGVALRKRDRVTAFLLCSASAEKVEQPWLNGEWIALKSPETLLFHYSAGVILLLRRVPRDAPPHASFACDQASSPSEKAICQSRELASWDRSVAEGFRQLLEWRRDEEQELSKAQDAWRKRRDECGAEATCLGEALRTRVVELAQ
jgi:uncharacterized protein YecT (DUF1311 family)